MKRGLLGVTMAMAMALPATAAAQDRGFFRATVGATVGTETGASFGGTIGMKAGAKSTIFGEIGGLTNVLPKSVTDQVDVAAALVAGQLGGKSSSTASASATYGLIGMRRNARTISGAQTFFDVGVGVARVKSSVSAVIRGSEQLQGDISDRVITSFTSSSPATKGALALGAGVVLDVTRTTAVEMGYRYLRIFTSSPGINAGNVYGAFKFLF